MGLRNECKLSDIVFMKTRLTLGNAQNFHKIGKFHSK